LNGKSKEGNKVCAILPRPEGRGLPQLIKFVGIDVSKAVLDFAGLPDYAPKQSRNCLNPVLLDHGQ
jgi:hypothetical protein